MDKDTKKPTYLAPDAFVLEFEMEQKVIMASGDLDDMEREDVYDEDF